MPIEQLREKIDRVDSRIISLLEERVDLAKKIGEAKRKHGLPVADPNRELEVLIKVSERTTKLNKGFVKKLFEAIIEYCKENE
ncbi:MAG: chorismate mutase [Candidatus Altiarchaeota archaeon]